MPVSSLYTFRLHIPCRIYEEMVKHARAELPNECCGMLGGRFREGISREAIAKMRGKGNEDTAWVVDASAVDIEGFYSAGRPDVR